MKTSMRNCIECKVEDVKTGAVNDQITLVSAGGDKFVAIITSESTKNLGLAPGVTAYALIKAPWVSLAIDMGNLKTSARNNFAGKVTNIIEGVVNAEVETTLPSGQKIVAIITKTSLQNMALKVGQDITVLVKASHILVAVKS